MTSVGYQQSRTGLSIDLIANAPPFSLDYFRVFARGGGGGAQLQPLNPRSLAPRFYIKTLHDSGVEIRSDIIERAKKIIANTVSEYSGGRFAAPAAIKTGAEDRQPFPPGWVSVTFQSVIQESPSAGGLATVGGDSGYIKLKYDPNNPEINAALPCYATVLSALEHEVVHTMGFWHATDPAGFNPFASTDGSCDGTHRPPISRYHARIMYSRAQGNLDPDEDPSSVLFSGPTNRLPPIFVDPVALFQLLSDVLFRFDFAPPQTNSSGTGR